MTYSKAVLHDLRCGAVMYRSGASQLSSSQSNRLQTATVSAAFTEQRPGRHCLSCAETASHRVPRVCSSTKKLSVALSVKKSIRLHQLVAKEFAERDPHAKIKTFLGDFGEEHGIPTAVNCSGS